MAGARTLAVAIAHPKCRTPLFVCVCRNYRRKSIAECAPNDVVGRCASRCVRTGAFENQARGRLRRTPPLALRGTRPQKLPQLPRKPSPPAARSAPAKGDHLTTRPPPKTKIVPHFSKIRWSPGRVAVGPPNTASQAGTRPKSQKLQRNPSPPAAESAPAKAQR